MAGLEAEGELKAKSRLREGVEGLMGAEALLRTGDVGRAPGGVTSECKTDVNNELACSVSCDS